MSYDPIIDRVVQMKPDGKVVRFIKGYIDSTDEKPTDGIYEGSSLFERDTGKTFNWSEKLNKWVVPDDIPGGSGGGSSGGGSGEILPAMTSITWAELKSARDNGTLVPGMQYRITDYICTTTQDETRAVSHPFDIIVTADSVDTLNENARACLHAGDNYYSAEENSANLSVWELKYCLDNDKSRFAWADETNGKGIVYYLKDDYNNECPYDFKQIQFARYQITQSDASVSWVIGSYTTPGGISKITELDTENPEWAYTFSADDSTGDIPHCVDTSVKGIDAYFSRNNIITAYIEEFELEDETVILSQCLNNVVLFGTPEKCNLVNTKTSTFSNYPYNITTNACSDLYVFDGINTFDSCYLILCDGSNNTFLTGCHDIICKGAYNYFYQYCSSCEVYDMYNTIGSYAFGCNNIFISGGQATKVGGGCTGINVTNCFGCEFEGNNAYINLSGISASNRGYYYHIMRSVQGTPNSRLSISATSDEYVKYVGKNSSGTIKTWNPADLVT